jgi:hypothetical protein
MAQSVTIDAKSSDGQKYQITFAKTDKDKGSITLKPKDGGSASSYELYNIKASSDSELTCKANVFPYPAVTCSAVEAGGKHIVRVAIGFLGTREYEVSQTDSDRLKKFIATAGFPT